MIKFPANTSLDGQLLIRNRGVPGYLYCIKIKYATKQCINPVEKPNVGESVEIKDFSAGDINFCRISFTQGCSCCGQSFYIMEIQSPNKNDIIKAIKKFGMFYYYNKDTKQNILWLTTGLMDTIKHDINDYKGSTQKIVKNYSIMLNFLINVENNNLFTLSDDCKIKFRRIKGNTYNYDNSMNKFVKNKSCNYYEDDKILKIFH